MDYTREELKIILSDVMNMGMRLRQDQLHGEDGRSGNELLDNYMDDKFGVIKHEREIIVTRYYTKSCTITLKLPESILDDVELVKQHLDDDEDISRTINDALDYEKLNIEREDNVYYEPI